MILPNPFGSSPSPVSDAAGPTQRSFATTPGHTQSDGSNASRNSDDDGDAPPAYEAAGKYVGYKPDVKAKPTLSTTNATGGSSSAAATSSSALTVPATSAASAAATSTPVSSALVAGDKTPSSRPLSSNSTLTTIYDMRDAYAGI